MTPVICALCYTKYMKKISKTEPTLRDVMTELGSLETGLGHLAGEVAHLSARVGDLAGLPGEVADLSTRLDNLALATKHGFDGTATKTDLDHLEARMNKKFEVLEYASGAQSVKWEKDFAKLYEQMDDHDQRINTMEDKIVRL